jgi:hypothetical protein
MPELAAAAKLCWVSEVVLAGAFEPPAVCMLWVALGQNHDMLFSGSWTVTWRVLDCYLAGLGLDRPCWQHST